ncbi:hypothetical protein, partial [Crocosphaera sp.]|uniref:hypothetical protein n=1 Tax=Crocosphaera sp. TaxID=2729996 RepID=UPI00258070D4
MTAGDVLPPDGTQSAAFKKSVVRKWVERDAEFSHMAKPIRSLAATQLKKRGAGIWPPIGAANNKI